MENKISENKIQTYILEKEFQKKIFKKCSKNINSEMYFRNSNSEKCFENSVFQNSKFGIYSPSYLKVKK